MNWHTHQHPRAQNGLGWGMNLERQVKARQFRKEGTLQRAICILIFVLLSCHPCCPLNAWKGIYKSNLKSHTNLLGSPRNLSERRDSTGQSQLLVRMELKSITARLCCREDSQTPRLTTQLCPIPMSIRTESAHVVTGHCLMFSQGKT